MGGGQRIIARNYVDATGDGWLCLDARCEPMTGQEPRDRFDEPSAPPQATANINGVTLIYRVAAKTTAGIEPLPSDVPAKCWWRGGFPVAQMNHYPNGDLNINMLPTMDGQEFLQRGYQACVPPMLVAGARPLARLAVRGSTSFAAIRSRGSPRRWASARRGDSWANTC